MSGLWSICAFAFGQNRSNVDVVHAGLLEGKPHELAAPLDRGPGATALPSRSISFILS